MSLRDPRALAATVVAGALLTLAGKLLGWPALVWIFKPATTIVIAAAAYARGAGGSGPQAAYARAVLIGLLFSLAGDVLLIPEGLFVYGLVAFLLAHVAYLYAFTRDARLAARWLPFAIVAAVALAMLAVLWPGLPAALKLPVVCYVVMLGGMTAQSAARAAVLGGRAASLAAVGGALFMASDALLAFDRFHSPVPLASVWILGTYWGAQLLIALSVESGAPDARRGY